MFWQYFVDKHVFCLSDWYQKLTIMWWDLLGQQKSVEYIDSLRNMFWLTFPPATLFLRLSRLDLDCFSQVFGHVSRRLKLYASRIHNVLFILWFEESQLLVSMTPRHQTTSTQTSLQVECHGDKFRDEKPFPGMCFSSCCTWGLILTCFLATVYVQIFTNHVSPIVLWFGLPFSWFSALEQLSWPGFFIL